MIDRKFVFKTKNLSKMRWDVLNHKTILLSYKTITGNKMTTKRQTFLINHE
jgi:hypothetical protein